MSTFLWTVVSGLQVRTPQNFTDLIAQYKVDLDKDGKGTALLCDRYLIDRWALERISGWTLRPARLQSQLENVFYHLYKQGYASQYDSVTYEETEEPPDLLSWFPEFLYFRAECSVKVKFPEGQQNERPDTRDWGVSSGRSFKQYHVLQGWQSDQIVDHYARDLVVYPHHFYPKLRV